MDKTREKLLELLKEWKFDLPAEESSIGWTEAEMSWFIDSILEITDG